MDKKQRLLLLQRQVFDAIANRIKDYAIRYRHQLSLPKQPAYWPIYFARDHIFTDPKFKGYTESAFQHAKTYAEGQEYEGCKQLGQNPSNDQEEHMINLLSIQQSLNKQQLNYVKCKLMGYSREDIADKLEVSVATVSRLAAQVKELGMDLGREETRERVMKVKPLEKDGVKVGRRGTVRDIVIKNTQPTISVWRFGADQKNSRRETMLKANAPRTECVEVFDNPTHPNQGPKRSPRPRYEDIVHSCISTAHPCVVQREVKFSQAFSRKPKLVVTNGHQVYI